MFQNRIFNVLEKANNNIKLTIVEHLVFSQIQRIQNSQREKKFEKRTDKGRKRYENCTQTKQKQTHFTDGDQKPPEKKVAAAHRKQ